MATFDLNPNQQKGWPDNNGINAITVRNPATNTANGKVKITLGSIGRDYTIPPGGLRGEQVGGQAFKVKNIGSVVLTLTT